MIIWLFFRLCICMKFGSGKVRCVVVNRCMLKCLLLVVGWFWNFGLY